ncbi:related to cop9 complex subunit 3 [Sporisorium reilianum f. sp. reilianum]|uniref:Related to cop9 complex subunit 3 n=1 Tax=Sporisorium reilianum f. sp. reilianum TaxID=72559 RepID=A0A2N8U7F8_9BASI|nr:related to cop9 complex subunit 3 [Sporisorium reilianum f. sp. reilianum]
MTIPILTNIEDTLALILDCSSDLARIRSNLLPALRRLSSNPSAEAESSSRSGPSSSRAQTSAAAPAVSETILCQPIQGNVDPLSALDPAAHSLGMLYILAARATHSASSTDDATILLPHITAFVQRFDLAQVQLAGDKLTQLAATFSGLGDRVTNPESALQLLQALTSRFLTRPESITTLHPVLAYQYLKAARYAEAATMLIDHPLIDADTTITPLTHSDILQYFYYSALIYIKLDRLHDAIDALETCISSPAIAVSAIHMDAYKKLVLVQLLADGKTSPPPKYTPQAVTRTFHQLAQPYAAFASAYERSDDLNADEVFRIAEEKRDAFEKDRNVGLVRRCLALYRQRRIQRLAKVYSALSLNDIAHRVGAEGADAVQSVYADVQDMVRKRWIHASLSPPPSAPSASADAVNGDWVVRFDTFGGDAYTSTTSIALLEDKIRTAKQWQTLLQQRDRQVEKSQAYLTRGLKIRDARTAGAEAYSGADEFDDADY